MLNDKKTIRSVNVDRFGGVGLLVSRLAIDTVIVLISTIKYSLVLVSTENNS